MRDRSAVRRRLSVSSAISRRPGLASKSQSQSVCRTILPCSSGRNFSSGRAKSYGELQGGQACGSSRLGDRIRYFPLAVGTILDVPPLKVQSSAGRTTMRFSVIASTVVACAFAIGASAASAGPKGQGQGQGRQMSGPPPHASTTGMAARSDVVSRRGANRRGFCPPGQAKKRGRGSAFNC